MKRPHFKDFPSPRRPHLEKAGLLTLGIALAIGATVADARTGPQYRVTWLTEPIDPKELVMPLYGIDVLGTMGINNLGEVVYVHSIDSHAYNNRPFIWLPDAAYGLSPGFHSFADLCNNCFALPAVARDISDEGVIVGQSGGQEVEVGRPGIVSNGAGEATAWTFDWNGLTTTLLGRLQTGQADWSGAHAVNNQDPPLIVGAASRQSLCACNGPDLKDQHWGFMILFDQFLDLNEIPPVGGDIRNAAMDVNTPSSGDALIGGYSLCWEELNYCEVPSLGHPCGEHMYGAKWDAGLNVATHLGRVTDFGHEVRGLNDAGLMVGLGRDGTGSCPETAVYWQTSSSPFNLGTIMPSGQGTHQSRAEAINNLTLPYVVGINPSIDHGLLWEKTGSQADDWDVYDLNDQIGNLSGLWIIRQAHDVNDSNWIVGLADRIVDQTLEGRYTVLLTPLGACHLDLNGDGCVDADDARIIDDMIENEEDCEPNFICHADVNRDGVVDYADLVMVQVADCQINENLCCLGCGSLASLTLSEFILEVLNGPLSTNAKIAVIEYLLTQ